MSDSLADLTSNQIRFITGDFVGGGRTGVMLYITLTGDWWLGQFDDTTNLQWSRVSTAGVVAPTTGKFLVFTGDFTGGGRTEVMFYYSGDSNWRLGQVDDAASLQWSGVGNTTGYGDMTSDQILVFTGDFTDGGRSQVMFYYAGDSNWRLGQVYNAASLQWSGVGNSITLPALTGNPFRFFTGDFTGSGRAEVMFFYSGDNTWRLGQLIANGLQWSLVGTTGFGDLTGSQFSFFTGDFTGSGRTEVMFFYSGDNRWWLGRLDNDNDLQWSLVGTTGFGDLTGSQFSLFTGDFTGGGSAEVMFYYSGDGYWWLGQVGSDNTLQWSRVGRLGLKVNM